MSAKFYVWRLSQATLYILNFWEQKVDFYEILVWFYVIAEKLQKLKVFPSQKPNMQARLPMLRAYDLALSWF